MDNLNLYCIFSSIRVIIVIIFISACFLLTSFAIAPLMAYIGIICGSFSAGLSEVTFLAYSASFDSTAVSYFCSGISGAGLFGSVSYAVLTHSFMNPRQSFLLMMIMPVLLATTFWCFITPKDSERTGSTESEASSINVSRVLDIPDNSEVNQEKILSFRDKLSAIIVSNVFIINHVLMVNLIHHF